MKGFRPGIDKAKIVGKMSDADYEEMKQRQGYFTIKDVEPLRAKVLLANDSGRRQIYQAKLAIRRMLSDIDNVKATLERCKIEMGTEKITTEIKPGVPMTKEELNVYMARQVQIAWATSQDVVVQLNTIQAWIDRKDMARKVIISSEEFENYVKDLKEEFDKRGYDIFENG